MPAYEKLLYYFSCLFWMKEAQMFHYFMSFLLALYSSKIPKINLTVKRPDNPHICEETMY